MALEGLTSYIIWHSGTLVFSTLERRRLEKMSPDPKSRPFQLKTWMASGWTSGREETRKYWSKKTLLVVFLQLKLSSICRLVSFFCTNDRFEENPLFKKKLNKQSFFAGSFSFVAYHFYSKSLCLFANTLSLIAGYLYNYKTHFSQIH